MSEVPVELAPPSRREAAARLEQALQHIERAQREIERAMQLVSNLVPLAPEWKHLGKVYDRIRAAWSRVARKRDAKALDLDGIAKEALARVKL